MEIKDLMKVDLFEQTSPSGGYEIRPITRSVKNELHRMVKLYEENGFYRGIKPSKILQRIGSKGKIWGLYDARNELVGTITIKSSKFDFIEAGEIGLFYVRPDAVTLKNVSALLQTAIKEGKKHDIVYAITSKKNKGMETIMINSGDLSPIFDARSPNTNQKITVWLSSVSNGKFSEIRRVEILKQRFADLMQ